MKFLQAILKKQRVAALSFVLGGILFSLGRQVVLAPAISRDSPHLLPDFLFFLFLSDVIVNTIGASLADAYFKESQKSARSALRYIALIAALHVPVTAGLIAADPVIGIAVSFLSLIYSLNQVALKCYQRENNYVSYLGYNAVRFVGYGVLAVAATTEPVPVLISLLAVVELLAASPLWICGSVFKSPGAQEGPLNLRALGLFMGAYGLSALTLRCDVLLGTRILAGAERVEFSQLLTLASLAAFPLSLFTGGYFFNRLCELKPKIRSFRLMIAFPALICLAVGGPTWLLGPSVSQLLLGAHLDGTERAVVAACSSLSALLPYFRSIQLALQTSMIVMVSNAISLVSVTSVLFLTATDANAAILGAALTRTLALYGTLYGFSRATERVPDGPAG